MDNNRQISWFDLQGVIEAMESVSVNEPNSASLAFKRAVCRRFGFDSAGAFTERQIKNIIAGIADLVRDEGFDPGNSPKIFLRMCGIDPEPSETRSEGKDSNVVEGTFHQVRLVGSGKERQ